MSVTRTFDLLDRLKELYPKEDAIAGKKNKKWIKYSTESYVEYVNFLSYGLLKKGIKKGDKVATIINNRPEWNFIDMALSQIGAIHVPVYPTISSAEYEYIFEHAEVEYVFVGTKALLSKVQKALDNFKGVKEIYTIDKVEDKKSWKDIVELGKNHENECSPKLKKLKKEIKEDECVTLIYTSGTTGKPKGVMLSHKNIMTNAILTSEVYYLGSQHRALSFLPLCHIYERMLNYNFQYKGLSIYYAENMGTIAQNIKEVRPHIFNTVPRLLERVYDGIIGKGKNLPFIQKVVFFWAVRLGLKFDLKSKSPWYKLRLKIARRLVFNKWIEGLGGEIKVIVSGGAALQSRLGRIFWAAGIDLAQGYGLTETSPVIAVNELKKGEIKLDTVGKILPKIDAKISDDGEILCKGPCLMMGYYKAPELTKEVIDKEGYFHTGDIGIIDEEGFLKITDRKKEMFKTSSGKYIAPQVIENKMKESFFIEQAIVVGENKKFASSLISPNFNFLHDWCSRHRVQFRDNKELVRTPEVIARYQKEVNKVNANLGEHEQIKRFRLVCEEWSPQSGELSPTLKLKRNIIYKKYSDLLEGIYGPKDKLIEESGLLGINLDIKSGIKKTIQKVNIVGNSKDSENNN